MIDCFERQDEHNTHQHGKTIRCRFLLVPCLADQNFLYRLQCAFGIINANVQAKHGFRGSCWSSRVWVYDKDQYENIHSDNYAFLK